MGLLGLKVTLALFVLALTEGKDLHQYRSLPSAGCDNGEAVIALFAACGVDSLIDAGYTMPPTSPTKEAAVQFLKSYCGEVLPSTKECFAQNTSACNSEYLQQLVDSTGFHCQPGGTEPNSVLMYLLDRLGSITVPYGECSYHIPENCYDDAALESDIDADTLPSYTLEQLAARAQNFVRSLVECAIGWHKSRADTCPNWRSTALVSMAPNALPSFLGVQFPFTQEQMAELLEECFAQNTSACNSEYLQQLVDSTGIQCQPGGTEPNSVLMYVLDRLESITVPSEECSHRIPQYCYDDASAESGMYAETLSSYTAEQVAPRAQNYLASVVECAIGWYKSRADRCPDWRSTILFFLAPNALPSFLGGQFPFTEAEMAELLEVSISGN
ncbi:hypothetical protein BaRGS_00023013 [Batillaria attramentaria]|uniref:Secreted protein n=1 Tax=Batillaria attramentaria TaxID=370345 RepID=A0ABD0KF83_9CAEN